MRFQEKDPLYDEPARPGGPRLAEGEDDHGQDHAAEDDPELKP